MDQYLSKKHRLIGALLITFTLYFLFSISGRLYTFKDNITVGVVVSGMYGDNNMCQYLHPLLCAIIKCLNPILPTADVFATLTHAALLFGIFLISYAVIEMAFQIPAKKWSGGDIILRATALLAVVYFTLGMKLFGVNYTVQTSAIIAEGVIVMMYAAYRQKGTAWVIAGTAVIFAGFLGRIEACLLFLPFLAIDAFVDFVRTKDRKRHIRQNLKYFLPAIAVMIALLASKAVFLKTEPYKSDAAYNHYRTIAEDYPMETYGVNYKDFSGIDHSTYNMVLHWILLDTDLINTETLQRIAEVGSRNDYQYTRQGLEGALQEMRRQATARDVHLMTLLGLTVLLTLWNVLANKSKWLKLEAVCCPLGGFIILFYFTFRGRAPIRVWQCTLIAAVTVLTLVTIKGGLEEKTGKKKPHTSFTVFLLLICVVLYFGLGQVMAHFQIHKPTIPLTARIGADDSGYEATFEDDALYLWPNWYTMIPDYFYQQDKLPTQRVIEHNIAFGDWIYGQVYFREFLQRIGAENPALALLERPNTYFIEGQEELLMQYMREHYGEDIQMEYVRKINGKNAYRLVRENSDDN